MTIRKYIPDAITSGNLICGSLGVIASFNGRLDLAFLLILGAAVCDFFDGFSARLLGAYSPLGKELDSLADDISFGLLPAVIMFKLTGADGILRYVPLLIAVFSALRLAKFNIDERQKENFIGLATPACAILCGAIAYYVSKEPESFLAAWCGTQLFIPCLSIVLCALLICEVPMFSFKFKKGSPADARVNRLRIILAVLAVVSLILVAVFSVNWSMAAIISLLLYIVLNFVALALERKS